MYATPDHSHAMLEMHATIATWNSDKLPLHRAIQLVGCAVLDLSKILGIAKEKIRMAAPNIGGGFGGEGSSLSDEVLPAMLSMQSPRRNLLECGHAAYVQASRVPYDACNPVV